MEEKNHINLYAIIIVVAVIMVVALPLIRAIDKASNRREVIGTVTDKGVKNKSDDSKYLVYTEDQFGNIAVYEITDSLFAGRFDSSDTYAGIKVGKTYKFDVGGTRSEIFSFYPNIYGYEEIKKER